uniref:Uncharacterized protein n=1 Tax=Rhizophora mucronata TaxID=61149 RepID=A0A2P2R0S4_RHIMU
MGVGGAGGGGGCFIFFASFLAFIWLGQLVMPRNYSAA